MSRTLSVLSLAILFVGVAGVGLAASHEEAAAEAPVYVWISTAKAQPGQGDALVELLMRDAEYFDPLVDSGAALDWGIAIPVVHSGGDTGIRHQWISFVGWAGADQFMQAFMSRMQAMSAEERKAMGEEWSAVVEPGSHVDTINRGVHMGSGSSARASYIHLTYFTAKPGSDPMDFYHEAVEPIYAQLGSDGAIIAYGVHVPSVKHGETWTHMDWVMTENLAARDTIDAAFDAQIGSSPDEAMKWQKAMTELFEPGREDQILMVVHHKTPGGGDDGDDGDGE